MNYLCIALFSIAAFLGMVLLTYVLSNKETPKGISIIHGFFAGLGIVALLIYCLLQPNPLPYLALGLFVIVALVGFYLFIKDLANKVPKLIALMHGLAAICVFTFFVYILFFNV